MTTEPHVLTLRLVDDDYDPECPNFWDEAELTCPHIPPTATMPCAVWDLCGCKPKTAEITNVDWGIGSGPCPTSAIGVHHYYEGEPQKPLAECWPVEHADELDHVARELGLPPGTYFVIPHCVNDALQLEVVADPTEVQVAS